MTSSGISKAEKDLLREVVRRHRPALLSLVDDADAGRSLTADEANVLRDAIGEELTRSGVDADVGAVNEYGKRLDVLIDRVAEMSDLYRG